MLRGIISVLIISVCFGFTTQAFAKKKPVAAVEVTSISVKLNLGGKSGSVTAEGCGKCPLFLTFTEKTKFLAKGKKIQAAKATAYNNKSGTVIFDPKSNQVKKVVW